MSFRNWVMPALLLGLLAGCAETASRPEAEAPKAAVAPEMAVESAVRNWAAAWQSREVGTYLSAYAADFKPEKGSRAAWEKQRKARIGKAKDIKLTLSNISVKLTGEDCATATFMQAYKSDSYSDQGVKVLEFRKTDGRWLITREFMP